MQPFWKAFEPASGQCFAMAWHNGHRHAAMSFHDAEKGQLLASVDLLRHLSPVPAGCRLCYTWSPSGKFIEAHGWGYTQASSGAPSTPRFPQAAIIGDDGSCRRLDIDARSESFDVGWSPCGRYLHLTACSLNHTPKAFDSGFIWDTLQRTYVHVWHNPCHGFSPIYVTWPAPSKQSTQRTTCLVKGDAIDGTLLMLPSLSGLSRIEKLQIHAREDDETIFVSGLLVRESYQANPEELGNGNVKATHLLHTELSRVSTALRWKDKGRWVSWQLDSIAWHPTPASRRLYAIADEDCTVCLVDGCYHKPLRSRSAQELGIKDSSMDDYWEPLLRWSPCGSQLVVMAPGLTTFLCFD